MRYILTVFATIMLLAIAGCGDNPTEQAEQPATQSDDSTSTETATESTDDDGTDSTDTGSTSSD